MICLGCCVGERCIGFFICILVSRSGGTLGGTFLIIMNEHDMGSFAPPSFLFCIMFVYMWDAVPVEDICNFYLVAAQTMNLVRLSLDLYGIFKYHRICFLPYAVFGRLN